MDYFLHHMSDPVDIAAFEEASGVGVVFTPDQIEAGVESVINKHKQELLEKRYHVNTGVLIGNCFIRCTIIVETSSHASVILRVNTS